MSARPVFVYRLNVEVPESVRWPKGPTEEQINAAVKLGMMDSRDEWSEGFVFPSWRNMLSRSSAHRKAAILRALGCSVTVERSNRVTFGAGSSVKSGEPNA